MAFATTPWPAVPTSVSRALGCLSHSAGSVVPVRLQSRKSFAAFSMAATSPTQRHGGVCRFVTTSRRTVLIMNCSKLTLTSCQLSFNDRRGDKIPLMTGTSMPFLFSRRATPSPHFTISARTSARGAQASDHPQTKPPQKVD
jgi:hypothetical protein